MLRIQNRTVRTVRAYDLNNTVFTKLDKPGTTRNTQKYRKKIGLFIRLLDVLLLERQ
jgi:hypothetical protein